MTTPFLATPGRAGTFGTILDETARAAEDFCTTVEAIPADLYLEKTHPDSGRLASIHGICLHCVNCGYRYSNFIRDVRGLAVDSGAKLPSTALADPADVRGALTSVFRHTEQSVDGLWDAGLKAINALSFTVSWGPTFNPELILEHGLVHLLRHRRQIERRLA